MDRHAIARARRHRTIAERLEEERAREAVLTEQLEEVITDLEGPGIDEIVLEQLPVEDATYVRGIVQGGVAIELGIEEDFFAGLADDDDEVIDTASELEDEIARLRAAIEESQTRQRALQGYLDGLTALPDREDAESTSPSPTL
jgi:hypothetical protein